MADLRPELGPAFAAFGVAATVTPAGGTPVATTVVWVDPRAQGVTLGGFAVGGQSAIDLRRRVRLRRDQVATLPPGSTIVAPPPEGGAPQSFTVDRVETLADVLQAVLR